MYANPTDGNPMVEQEDSDQLWEEMYGGLDPNDL